MGVRRRVNGFLRPLGYVPYGTPTAQARAARWRQFSAVGTVSLFIAGLLLMAAGVGDGLVLCVTAFWLGVNALQDWRVVHFFLVGLVVLKVALART